MNQENNPIPPADEMDGINEVLVKNGMMSKSKDEIYEFLTSKEGHSQIINKVQDVVKKRRRVPIDMRGYMHLINEEYTYEPNE